MSPAPWTADAVLVLGFGGPEGPDEVWPFLERVTAGRGVPRERLAVVAEHYLALGGVSPINAQNRTLAGELETRLRARGVTALVTLAHRNSPPYAVDGLSALAAGGARRVLALATSAFPSYSGCRQYREDLGQGLLDAGLADPPEVNAASADAELADAPVADSVLAEASVEVRKIGPFFELDALVEANVRAVADGLARLAEQGCTQPIVFFSTHSLPITAAAASGPDDQPDGGPDREDGYSAAHRLVAAEVIRRIRRGDDTAGPLDWRLVYQSRSGAPSIPWLEPDIVDALGDVAATRATADPTTPDGVLVVPLGFLTDHVEVRWDLDTQAGRTAYELGVPFVRAATIGTDPGFLDALADLVAHHATGGAHRAPARLAAARGDRRRCADGCCANPRSTRPAVAAARTGDLP